MDRYRNELQKQESLDTLRTLKVHGNDFGSGLQLLVAFFHERLIFAGFQNIQRRHFFHGDVGDQNTPAGPFCDAVERAPRSPPKATGWYVILVESLRTSSRALSVGGSLLRESVGPSASSKNARRRNRSRKGTSN